MRIFLGFSIDFNEFNKDIYPYNNIYPGLLPKVFSKNCIFIINCHLSYLLVQPHYP